MYVWFEGSDFDDESDDDLYEEVFVLDVSENLGVVSKVDVDEDIVINGMEDLVLKDEILIDLDYLKSCIRSGVWSDDDDDEDEVDD